VIESLLCKCEALSSNPSPTPLPKKKEILLSRVASDFLTAFSKLSLLGILETPPFLKAFHHGTSLSQFPSVIWKCNVLPHSKAHVLKT
jgi:hypothetical protein